MAFQAEAQPTFPPTHLEPLGMRVVTQSFHQGLHSMTTTAADVLVDTLSSWGIDTIFGIPGDGINGIMESLEEEGRCDPLHPGEA